MSLIREPKHVDLLIANENLTDKDKKEIKEFIESQKRKKVKKSVKTINKTA